MRADAPTDLIARAMGVSDDTVQWSVKKLQEHGLIDRWREFRSFAPGDPHTVSRMPLIQSMVEEDA